MSPTAVLKTTRPAPQTPTVDVEAVAARLAKAPPEAILEWGIATFWPNIALATSFQNEGVVLIDLVRRLRPDFPVFAIDTGRLPEETQRLADLYRSRGVNVRWFFPEHAEVEAWLAQYGPNGFRTSVEAREACCQIRKVAPMRRALAGLAAWVNGRRRAQSAGRQDLPVVEPDRQNPGKIKLNPLAAWSDADVQSYVRAHELPYNALYDRGYASIGCAPCTRAVQPGEPTRAGRWWWESDEHKECGLHVYNHGGGI